MYVFSIVFLLLAVGPAIYILLRFIYIPPGYVVVTRKRGYAMKHRILPTGLAVFHPHETAFHVEWEQGQPLVSTQSRHYSSENISITTQDGATITISFLVKYRVIDAGLWIARESSPLKILQDTLTNLAKQKALSLQFESLFHIDKTTNEAVLCRSIKNELTTHLSVLGAEFENICIKDLHVPPDQTQNELLIWLQQKTAEGKKKAHERQLSRHCEEIKRICAARAEAHAKYIDIMTESGVDMQTICSLLVSFDTK